MKIYTVAKFFLQKETTMSHKKLQGLCYYSYAWWFVFYKEELFEDKFEAWVHGAINRNLYSDFHYNENILSLSDKYILSKRLEKFLEEVWDTYGRFSGLELDSIIKQEDAWRVARGWLKPYAPGNTVIKNEDILLEYGKRIKRLT